MEKEYKIKGIDKIIKAICKEDLARFFFQKEKDVDYEVLITECLKGYKIPNGMEIAGYETIDLKDRTTYFNKICEKYLKDGKGLIVINFPITKNGLTELYFYIDEPIKNEVLNSIIGIKTHFGDVSTLGYTMGKGFYENHKDELIKFKEEFGKTIDETNQFDYYEREYFNRLSQVRLKENECDYLQKQHMAGAEMLIAELTGRKSITDITLQELEQVKQALIARNKKVKQAFSERFCTNPNQVRE